MRNNLALQKESNDLYRLHSKAGTVVVGGWDGRDKGCIPNFGAEPSLK